MAIFPRLTRPQLPALRRHPRRCGRGSEAPPRKFHATRTGVVLAALIALGLLAGCTTVQERKLSALHYFNRGNAAFMAEDYGRALQHYRMALDLDAQSAELHFNMGLAFSRIGDDERAVEAYGRALDLRGDFAEAHLNAALAYNRLYNLEAADFHYNAYRRLVVGTPPSSQGAANSGAGSEAGHQTAAQPTAQRAAAKQPGFQPKSFQQQGSQPQGANPFEGKPKWWTPDTRLPSQ